MCAKSREKCGMLSNDSKDGDMLSRTSAILIGV
jgi:hypothetical protein